MKSPTLLTLAILAASSAAAQVSPPPPPAITPMRIEHEVLPLFPMEMHIKGVRDGFVVVAFGVTAQGTVDDCLPIAYSDQAFADATVAAVREWTFDPVRVGGQPVASTSQLTFQFKTNGLVLLSHSGADGWTFDTVVPPLDRGFRTHGLNELDSIPRPISATAPVYPESLARRYHRATVTVEFFIDPTGAVRLPRVGPGANQELAALAIAAIQTWRFEPPMCHHRPVQVRASQVFQFEPPRGS